MVEVKVIQLVIPATSVILVQVLSKVEAEIVLEAPFKLVTKLKAIAI